mmetsp:Transcript_55448/g.102575  ORF Transcript_55448/g.102575 Transcript_55448/m.102575 type:complete len:130 (-) Transcript_55448:10-399(-)
MASIADLDARHRMRLATGVHSSLWLDSECCREGGIPYGRTCSRQAPETSRATLMAEPAVVPAVRPGLQLSCEANWRPATKPSLRGVEVSSSSLQHAASTIHGAHSSSQSHSAPSESRASGNMALRRAAV